MDDFTTQSPTEAHVRPLGRSRSDPSLVRVRSVCSELAPAVFGRRAIHRAVRLLGHGRLSGDSQVGAIDVRAAASRLGLGRSPFPGTFLLRGDHVHCHLASPSRGKRGMFENLWGLSNAGTTVVKHSTTGFSDSKVRIDSSVKNVFFCFGRGRGGQKDPSMVLYVVV